MAQGTIKVPNDLCEIQPVTADFAARVAERPDYADILVYLNANCPSQALAFADLATGSIPEEQLAAIVLKGREGWQVNKNGSLPATTPPSCEDDNSCTLPPPPPSCEDDNSCTPPPECTEDCGEEPPTTPTKVKFNNGIGNGDQDAPGGSCTRNNAENRNCTGGGSKGRRG